MEKVQIELHRQDEFMKLWNIKKTLPKKEWAPEAQLNGSIQKCIWNTERNHWQYLTLTDDKYANAVTKLFNKLDDKYDISIANAFLPYEQIIFVPENVNDGMAKLGMFGDCINIKCKEFTLVLTPYHNGINVLGICVNDTFRNKGIGTDVMNILYDLSEELDIPLFLTPYPDENCDKSEIWDRIYRLRDWYTKLGFGPWYGMNLLWTNYEDDLID